MTERPETTATRALPSYLTIQDVMALTKLSRTSVYEAVAAGKLQVVHFGRSVRVPDSAYLAFAAAAAGNAKAVRA
jgi:excisionase family DNA binding protein